MQFKRPLPLFFLLIFAIGIFIIPIYPVHASVPTYAGTSSVSGSGGTATITVSVVAGDFLGILASPLGSSQLANGYTFTDTFGDTFTPLYSGNNFACNTASAGLNTLSCAVFTQVNQGGTDIITVTMTNGFTGGPTVFIDHYSNVKSTSSSTIRGPCTSISPCVAHSGTDTFSPALVTSANQIVWEAGSVFGNSATGASSISANSAQSVNSNYLYGSGSIGASKSFQSNSCSSSCPSIAWTTDVSATGAFVDHGAVILTGAQPTGTGSITSCYGECGIPAITLVNPNATHPVNFNQSFTLFYEFQSNLNGVLLNVTTNVAKTYNNGQQIALGVYTASCPPGTTPFTIACAGSLQPGFAISNPSVPKGRFSIGTNIPVVSGQWIAIAFTAIYSGLDLNQTNGTCGDNTSGICASPGMFYSKGTIPQSLSQTSACNTTNSPCNFGSMSSTGLWAWINGNVVINTPLPPPSIGCINSDLACFMIASACALTPSNCFIGGAVYLFIYFTIFVAGISICISWVNSSYEVELHFPPAVFFLFFLVELFMFTAMGLIPQYVTIVVFIFTALGVAGHFASAFMGGRGRSD